MSATIRVEIVHALAARQWTVALALPASATVADALAAVAPEAGFADLDLARAAVGVWGEVVHDRERRLCDGDRVEIYRMLSIDPKDARRKRSADAAKRARGCVS